jgi:hypothetical protein
MILKVVNEIDIDRFIGTMGIYLLYFYCAVSCLYENLFLIIESILDNVVVVSCGYKDIS